MKKVFIATLASLLLAGCKSEEEKMLEKMETQIMALYDDLAFKNNSTIDFFDLQILSHDMTDENYLDTIRLSDNAQNAKYWVDVMEEKGEESVRLTGEYESYKKVIGEDEQLTQIAKEKAEQANRVFNECKDSATFYMKNDSIIRQRIIDRKSPKPVHRLKVHVKLTTADSNTNRKENYSETEYYFFDDNIRILEIK